MPAEIEGPSVTGYMSWLLRPFFRWWWAVLTGTASILGLILTPDSGITISRPTMLIGILLLLAFVFLGLSTATQGWALYFRKHRPIRVLSVQKVLSEQKAVQPHTDLLFVIDGFLKGGGGTLLDVRRALEGAETPFCIVKVTTVTEDGHFQATPIWASPGHLRAFRKNEFGVRDLRVTQSLTYDQVREALDGTR